MDEVTSIGRSERHEKPLYTKAGAKRDHEETHDPPKDDDDDNDVDGGPGAATPHSQPQKSNSGAQSKDSLSDDANEEKQQIPIQDQHKDKKPRHGVRLSSRLLSERVRH